MVFKNYIINKIAILFLVLRVSVALQANQSNSLDTEYSKGFTDFIEVVYGSDFLSQGGSIAVDIMFDGQDLEGKKLLDIGSGLGGVEFYLASFHKVDIIGVDRVLRLVEESNKRKIRHNLVGSITFEHQETDTDFSKYADETFDIIFSKESLLHVADKLSLLKEVFRMLKPGGQLIILDWLTQTNDLGPIIKEMMHIDGLDLKLATVCEYQDYFNVVGFASCSSLYMNQYYGDYTNKNIQTIESKHDELVKIFGQKGFEFSLKSWNLQKKIFEEQEVLVTLLKATKPVA